MSGFLICDVSVKNREALSTYLSLSESTLAEFGGKFHVQAGALEVIEGDWTPKVLIIAEFPSTEKAREWYNSSAYASALEVKPFAMDRNMVLVEGLS